MDEDMNVADAEHNVINLAFIMNMEDIESSLLSHKF